MKWFKSLFSKKKKPKDRTAPKAKKQTSITSQKAPSKSKPKSKINIQLFGKKSKNSTPKNANSNGHFQRHFRKFHSPKTTGHPAYVFDEKDNDYQIIGLTSSKTTKINNNEIENIPLLKNPEPNNNKPSFILPKVKLIKKGTKNDKLKGWSFCESDKKKVQDIIDKDKNN